MPHFSDFNRPAEILLVDDNSTDALLIEECLKESGVKFNLRYVPTGMECIKYLNQPVGENSHPRPDLILLDLNMPAMDGREVMAAIRKNEALATIPVQVLSTSENERDVQNLYPAGCNSYAYKPVDFEELQATITNIMEFWFETALLPSDNPH